MYLPFNKLPRFPNLANFENFRKGLAYLFTIINRLISGKTYIDTFSAQSVVTPIYIRDTNITIDKNSDYSSNLQIPNIANQFQITDIINNVLSFNSSHNYIKGMPLLYTQTGGTNITGLNNNRIYYVNEVTTGTSIKLANVYGGNALTLSTSVGTHTLDVGYPMTQLEETFLTPINNSLPSPTEGVLAYGDIYDSNKSTVYHHDGNAFKLLKLGWAGGQGIYNNEANDPQKFTGWCHGNGHYKIITSANQIKIQFDWIQLIQDVTNSKDYITGLRTNPVSDYNILIINSNAGLNSIDTGIVQANTSYYVYALYNPESDDYGAVISLNADKPNFPTNTITGTQYRLYQRLGWIRTDAVGSFLPSVQVNDRFCFIRDPGTAINVSFLGGGTSAGVPFVTAGVSNSLYYPNPSYLDSLDLMVELEGTGVNNDNLRTISINEIPYHQITPDTSETRKNDHFIHRLPVIGTNVDLSIAHPEDTGGTDYSNINFKFIGFTFNKGDLHV